MANAKLINDINVADACPYQGISISADTENIKKNAFGFNAGASLNFYVVKSFGIYVNTQYFSGSTNFDFSSEIPSLNVSLGGLQAGGGIKIMF